MRSSRRTRRTSRSIARRATTTSGIGSSSAPSGRRTTSRRARRDSPGRALRAAGPSRHLHRAVRTAVQRLRQHRHQRRRQHPQRHRAGHHSATSTACDSQITLDPRIARDIPLGGVKLQLIAEAFNLLNRDNISSVNTTLLHGRRHGPASGDDLRAAAREQRPADWSGRGEAALLSQQGTESLTTERLPSPVSHRRRTGCAR